MSDQTTNYTHGYSPEDRVLPYPWQVELPSTDQILPRYYATSQWAELTRLSPHASQALRGAWKDAQLDAAIAAVFNLKTKLVCVRGALRAIRAYADNPESPLVNAGEMTEAERLVGVAGQAQFGIDQINGL